MEKEFGKLSRQQLRNLYSIYHQTKIDGDELNSDLSEQIDLLQELLSYAPPWATWYELPILHHAILMFEASGNLEKIKKIAAKKDPQQALLDFLDSDEWLPKEQEVDEKELGCFLSILFALINQLKAISIYNQPMNTLVERAANGDDDALFNAVIVDRSVVATPGIARRIQLASFQNNESFLNRLAKAITKTRTVPRRPNEKLDDLRFMVEIIEESIGLKNISREKLFQVVVDDLELFETERKKDPYSAFNDLVKKRNKKARS